MLNVSYVNKIGYYTETQTIGGITKKYKIWFCHANALCAMMYFYNDVDKETGKTTKMVQLVNFFDDIKHAKRCIDDGYFDNASGFHINAKEMYPEFWKLVKYMVSKGIKVTLE